MKLSINPNKFDFQLGSFHIVMKSKKSSYNEELEELSDTARRIALLQLKHQREMSTWNDLEKEYDKVMEKIDEALGSSPLRD